jgi:serine/threonine-protein kinase
LIGQVVGGRYEVIRRIGKGGMGAIYEVRNTRLGRQFALKTLTADAQEDLETLTRFRREADVISRLKHAHIVEIIDWETLDDGAPCIVMEYLQGEDLARRIRHHGQLSWPFIARIGDQVLSALSVAHRAGIVHRDLKPQNIFLAVDDSGDERAKLLDFGVSKIRNSRATTDARLIGTPSYMSPEQAQGQTEDVGPPTDVWAMGAMLHEMATGELAFDGDNLMQILFKICQRDPEKVNAKRGDAPAQFVELVSDALQRDRDKRIPDAHAMRTRLRESLREMAGIQYLDTPIPGRESTRDMPTPDRRNKRSVEALNATIESLPIPVASPPPGGEGDESGTLPSSPPGLRSLSQSVDASPPSTPGRRRSRSQSEVELGTSPTMNSSAGQVLTGMQPRRRWTPWLVIGGLVAAVGVIVAIAVIPSDGSRAAARTPVDPQPSRVVVDPIDVPASSPDAAIAVVPVAVDAAIAVETTHARPHDRKPRPDAAPSAAIVKSIPADAAPKKDPRCEKNPNDPLCVYSDPH